MRDHRNTPGLPDQADREQWMKPGENPYIGQTLCTAKAHYALEDLPNKLLAGGLDRTLSGLRARQIARIADGKEGV